MINKIIFIVSIIKDLLFLEIVQVHRASCAGETGEAHQGEPLKEDIGLSMRV